MQPMVKRQLPFIIIVLLFVTISFLDRLLPEGMFSDGLIYATVGRNMAIGKGSFWMPYFGHGAYFYEHPPMMMGLESLFFRVFGDHYYTEKIYCAAAWLVTVLMIRRLWIAATDRAHGPLWWLPLLMWGTAATVLWSYPNNALECTMGIFDIAAFLYLYAACEGRGNRIWKFAAGGTFVVLASLTKGPVGLFPLAVPAIHWLAFRRHSFTTAVLQSLLVLLIVAGAYGIITLFSAPRNMLSHYLDQQLLRSLAGKRELVESSLGRYYILQSILMQLAPALVLVVLIWIAARLLKVKPQARSNRKFLFFFYTALSASLPVMVSVKQFSFYLLPSLPFYAVALSLLIAPYVLGLTQKYVLPPQASRAFRVLAAVAAIGGIAYLWPKAGTIGRDEDIINDVHQLATVISPADTMGICPGMEGDYQFSAYAARYAQLEVKPMKGALPGIIVSREVCPAYADSIKAHGYVRANISTLRYDLYFAH